MSERDVEESKAVVEVAGTGRGRHVGHWTGPGDEHWERALGTSTGNEYWGHTLGTNIGGVCE